MAQDNTYEMKVELSDGQTITAGQFVCPGGQDAENPNFTTSVETLSAGSSATVTLTGTYPNLNLHFGIPAGQDASTPNITVSSETLAAGSTATVTLSGTYPNINIHFGIPQGAQGAQGVSVRNVTISEVV